ncbi:hypothetical protein [Halobacterium rubrum]|uniref:hypothetical protein n=1 Tax=Halobacterium TaxID=2239 RepID=UPI001F2023B7|nr:MULTISPECIES: hypothetical protein [Halobacterium]MDH5019315.1 hypothetical protein [Halobacterium rubrum]
MSAEAATDTGDDEPWPQRLLDNIWLLALAAIIYFVVSYIVWGMVDLATIPPG